MKETKSKVETFLSYNYTKGTRKSYKTALNKFFKMFYEGKPKDYNLESECEKYFEQERNYDADVKHFANTIKDLAPKTAWLYGYVVRSFFKDEGIE